MKSILKERKKQKIEMFVCYAVAVLDMLFLKDVIRQMNPHLSGAVAGVFAFAIALLADYMAYDWGKKEGKRESVGTSRFMWIFLGIVYALLRIASVYFEVIKPHDYSFGTITYQIFAICFLTASYLTTGFVLRHQSAKYWDPKITKYLDYKEEFEEENKNNAHNEAVLDKMVETLESYNENYESLDKQYNEIKDTIRKEEKSIMAQIVGKVIKEHQNVNPDHANLVMEKVLRERDAENAKSHQR